MLADAPGVQLPKKKNATEISLIRNEYARRRAHDRQRKNISNISVHIDKNITNAASLGLLVDSISNASTNSSANIADVVNGTSGAKADMQTTKVVVRTDFNASANSSAAKANVVDGKSSAISIMQANKMDGANKFNASANSSAGIAYSAVNTRSNATAMQPKNVVRSNSSAIMSASKNMVRTNSSASANRLVGRHVATRPSLVHVLKKAFLKKIAVKQKRKDVTQIHNFSSGKSKSVQFVRDKVGVSRSGVGQILNFSSSKSKAVKLLHDKVGVQQSGIGRNRDQMVQNLSFISMKKAISTNSTTRNTITKITRSAADQKDDRSQTTKRGTSNQSMLVSKASFNRINRLNSSGALKLVRETAGVQRLDGRSGGTVPKRGKEHLNISSNRSVDVLYQEWRKARDEADNMKAEWKVLKERWRTARDKADALEQELTKARGNLTKSHGFDSNQKEASSVVHDQGNRRADYDDDVGNSNRFDELVFETKAVDKNFDVSKDIDEFETLPSIEAIAS